MKIKGIDHIGIAVKSIKDSAQFYQKALGLDISDEIEFPSQKLKLAFTSSLGTKIELLEPTDKESTIGKFLEKKGEGIHHICFMVEDIENALEELKSKGIELIDQKPRLNPHNQKIAFVNPKSTGGVLIELKEK
jgi:methylmalonyl-CoA/ethylmalonyl-CoA epimerase